MSGFRATRTPDRKEKLQNGRRIKEPGEPSFCLTTQDQHGILLCCCEGWKEGLPIREAKKDGCTMAFPSDGINLAYPNSTKSRGRVGRQCAQTLLTGGSMGVLLCCRIRRLTPRECCRLQAFEDFLFDRAKAAGISDAQHHTMTAEDKLCRLISQHAEQHYRQGTIQAHR